MPTVTIGFVPRERFSLAAESLQRIFDYTDIPFNLIVVNCNIPTVYWQQMEAVLQGRDNVHVIHRDHYLLPNQSKNLVIPEAHDEFLCLIENDNLVKDGWLSQLIAACEEYPADVAVPLMIEGPVGARKVHFDDSLGQIRTVETPEGPKLEVLPRAERKELDRGRGRRTVQFMEQHCLLFRRSVFDRIGRYDEALNTRDEIDLSLSLYQAEVRVVFEPKCEIHYIPPYPPRADEIDYFFMKWDLERAAQSRDRLRKKWNLVYVPGENIEFVKDRNRIGHLHKIPQELGALIPPERPFILVDQAQWLNTKILAGLHPIPFLERDGQYWGAPADDETAIRELNRLQQSGATAIVFSWQAFWWLEYYSGFHAYLQSHFPCILESDRLIVFGLKQKL